MHIYIYIYPRKEGDFAFTFGINSIALRQTNLRDLRIG